MTINEDFVEELEELITYFTNRDIEIMMEDSPEFQKHKKDFIKKYSPVCAECNNVYGRNDCFELCKGFPI